MKIILLVFCLLIVFPVMAQSSMRRCTLLPITDSVGGAVGYNLYEMVEKDLKKSNWCTYISNSNLINIFSKYRENLPQYLKTKQVLSTVADKLKVGSLIIIDLKHDINSLEIELNVYGENGEDLYFSEKTMLKKDGIDELSGIVQGWLEVYSKTIPYDAKINGILGDQITMDVGKGYPVKIGQKFHVKRLMQKKKHPLLKKIVDWETATLAEGRVFSISDNQALGMLKLYKSDKKIEIGDWIILDESVENDLVIEKNKNEENSSPGTLGVFSLALFGSSSSINTTSSSSSNRFSGNIFGIDLRAEAWITRDYFAAFEIERSLGNLKETSGNPSKSKVNVNNSMLKITGGYKYLPIGFFYGPQIDFYAGYVRHTFDSDYSPIDGLGKNHISGFVLGTAANIPLNREYRLFANAEFVPFPVFSEDDSIYGKAKSVSSMDLAIGLKYQYAPRITLDGTLETVSNKAKFNGSFKEISYKENRLKFGLSFNF